MAAMEFDLNEVQLELLTQSGPLDLNMDVIHHARQLNTLTSQILTQRDRDEFEDVNMLVHEAGRLYQSLLRVAARQAAIDELKAHRRSMLHAQHVDLSTDVPTAAAHVGQNRIIGPSRVERGLHRFGFHPREPEISLVA
ncbi:hypothetical protein [Dactylosporangium sp. NPDC050588]|uniref:hypothetical protein n=1 Tax=Dactylosporangium sp. NPDC050588 TaxID=3157211 RepID=UPI0033D1B268